MKVGLTCLLLLFALLSFAQDFKKNEFAVLIGAEIVPQRSSNAGTPINFGKGFALSGNYARHLAGENTAFFLEFPFSATANHDITTSTPGSITSIATFYVTPSLRVSFAHQSRFSPWVSAGFGYGLFEGSRLLNTGAENPTRNTSSGAVQVGGGVDIHTGIKVLVPISLRAEVRDFYTTSNPDFGIAVRAGGQHNIVTSGGIVLHF
jgi:opacity protein-like surface antigen